MAYFSYEGRDRLGKLRRGQITASARQEAVAKLKEKGINVTQLRETKPGLLQREISLGNSVKLKDFVIFLRQFATLLQSGISVVDSTKIMSEQTGNKALRKALVRMEEDIRGGNPLSAAAAKEKQIFPPIFINMIQAGEASGNIDGTLERLAVYYEKQHQTRQKVRSALAYPIAISVIAVGVVMFLLTSVVPTFTEMFISVGSELPAITRLVLGISDWLQIYWWLLIILAILAYAGIMIARKYDSSKYYLDLFVLRLPLFGSLLQKEAIARLTRTLSSLLASSVPILRSVAIVEKVIGNEVIARVMGSAKDALEQGQPLTTPMRKHWVFPPMVTQMVAIGEQTGTMDEMLSKVADFYEMEVENTTDQLKSLIEPIMIVVLAAIVGTIVLSVFIPMFEMFNQVGNR